MRFDAMRRPAGLLALVMGGALATSAQAVTFSYATFADTTGLQINGDASSLNIGGRDVMRLTPPQGGSGGSVYNTQAISLSSDYGFSTRFTFNIGSNNVNQYGEIGADGIAFVIQTVSNNVGGLGGGLGYAGITPSVEVEFDTYSNGGTDPRLNGSGSLAGNDHVAIMQNGEPNNHLAYAITSPTLELNGGQDITAFIDYDGAANLMQVRWSTDGLRPNDPGLNYSIDLASLFGAAPVYVGFSASTGADWSAQDIVNWAFNDTYNPITTAPIETIPAGSSSPGGVPEPATWAMMLAGFGAVGAAMRRRRKHAGHERLLILREAASGQSPGARGASSHRRLAHPDFTLTVPALQRHGCPVSVSITRAWRRRASPSTCAIGIRVRFAKPGWPRRVRPLARPTAPAASRQGQSCAGQRAAGGGAQRMSALAVGRMAQLAVRSVLR